MTNNSNLHKLNGGAPHTLEDRIAAALQDPAITAAELTTLLADADQGLLDAITIAERLQECSVDLLQSPDATKAREVAEFATFVVKRLQNAIPRLQERHRQVAAKARAAKWNTLADMVQANRDTLVAEFTEVYPQWVEKIVDFFQRVRAMDQEIGHVNSLAPNSASRRLESLNYQQLLATTKLFTLEGQPLWPPVQAPILPQNVMAVPPPHPGPNWAEAVDQRNRERFAENQRVATYYAQQAKAREDKENAEARAARERGLR